MRQWDYLVVEFSKIEKKGMGFSIASDAGYRPKWINGKQQQGWEDQPTFTDYLADLGQQGWELAGNGPAEFGGFSCVFKRSG